MNPDNRLPRKYTAWISSMDRCAALERARYQDFLTLRIALENAQEPVPVSKHSVVLGTHA